MWRAKVCIITTRMTSCALVDAARMPRWRLTEAKSCPRETSRSRSARVQRSRLCEATIAVVGGM
jgi:hypothetical protein